VTSNLRPWDHLDPRTRVLIVVGATILTSSTAPANLAPFALYLPLILLLIASSKSASWIFIIGRCFASAPFILLAAAMLLFQYDLTPDGRPGGIEPAAAVACKGFAAALLLSFLATSTGLAQILWAMRKLGSPESFNLILSMMYRYTSLLSEEWRRLQRARDSRTVRPLATAQLVRVYARQLGVLLVRSWDRAERVHAAMLSRGFHGVWPVWDAPRFRFRDGLFLVLVIGAFAAARFDSALAAFLQKYSG
jgi:cobalt/nickel transport system permease protein